MAAKESEYNGYPTLCLNPDDRFGQLSFGVRKARLILEHIEEIRAFVEKHDSE